MGKTTRWFRALLGMKKTKENGEDSSSFGLKKDKKRWSFTNSGKEDSTGIIPAYGDSSWLRTYFADTQKEQTKHAIAVAAATAAAADAATAAAKAAIAVVRLTSQARVPVAGRALRAAIKIQTTFRSYLARKALRALKGLVKLQALVRGFLVRKRAAATLHSMQALFRAQAVIRDQSRLHSDVRRRKSTERYHENAAEFHSKRFGGLYEYPVSPKIVEIDPGRPRRTKGSFISEYNDVSASHLPIPGRLSIPEYRNPNDFDWSFIREDNKCLTSQNTPRLGCSVLSPAKSLCIESFSRGYPSYMANTHSFNAKLRSQSAPRQRHECGVKKRVPLNELLASRSSFSGVRFQRSCSRVHEDFEC